jgi:septal ring factor EnvC (AmiA/AmiB activator)
MNPFLSEGGFAAFLTGIFTLMGILLTKVLTYRRALGNRNKPKDRVEQTFDILQAGLKQAYDENNRLHKSLEESKLELDKAHKIIQKQQEYITKVLTKVQDAQDINQELIEQLSQMRTQYNKLNNVTMKRGENIEAS